MSEDHKHDYTTSTYEEQRGAPRPGDGALAYYEIMQGTCSCGETWTKATGNVSVR